jgi:beta-glucanase (GH16 family)
VRYLGLITGAAILVVLATVTTAAPTGITLCSPIFADEFSGTQLDTTRWDTTYPSGDAERQAYQPDALTVSGGLLRIAATARPAQGHPYTSGIITTQDTFAQQYGYFEIRARVPHGQGLWPAFWLLHAGPLPWTEIDVFEVLANDTTTLYMSNHWRDDSGQPQFLTQPFSGPDFSKGFHTFGVSWTADQLTWYVDGIPQAETRDNVPAEPLFMLANLAVGGQWPGYPDSTTHFPAYLYIDYIRVYDPGCHPGLFGLIGKWPK